MTVAGSYLAELERELRLDERAEEEVLQEIYDHLQDRVAEFCESGYSREEAVRKAIDQLGPAKSVARQIHEARSGGSWKGAFLAGMPHFLIALVFAFHLWWDAPWVAVVLIPLIALVTYGFRKYKPCWLYPWLGYSVLASASVFVVAGKLISFSSPWYWLMGMFFLPPAIWLAGSVFIQALRRDWLLASLALLPFPVTSGWLLAFEKGIGGYQGQSFEELDLGMALSFVVLGVTTATFIRLRKRLFRGALLLVAIVVILMLILPAKGTGLFLLASFISGLIFLPALLEPRLKSHLGEPAWLRQVTGGG